MHRKSWKKCSRVLAHPLKMGASENHKMVFVVGVGRKFSSEAVQRFIMTHPLFKINVRKRIVYASTVVLGDTVGVVTRHVVKRHQT